MNWLLRICMLRRLLRYGYRWCIREAALSCILWLTLTSSLFTGPIRWCLLATLRSLLSLMRIWLSIRFVFLAGLYGSTPSLAWWCSPMPKFLVLRESLSNILIKHTRLLQIYSKIMSTSWPLKNVSLTPSVLSTPFLLFSSSFATSWRRQSLGFLISCYQSSCAVYAAAVSRMTRNRKRSGKRDNSSLTNRA